jgi:antitoxin (DNA-binding transcriptional repressor) of toxin-antitoxin stability system
MTKVISQRELRNDSAAIMRALDEGEAFVITRNGVPVGQLKPVGKRPASRDEILAAFANLPRIDPERFRRDLDDIFGTEFEPRA